MCRGKTEVIDPRTDSKWLFRSGMCHFHSHLLTLLARESHMVKPKIIGAKRRETYTCLKLPYV